MNLLLSELLPLRTTRALGDYAEDTILPEVLGDLTEAPFPLIRLDDSRFFAADHPMEVTAVYVERQLVADWAMVLEAGVPTNLSDSTVRATTTRAESTMAPIQVGGRACWRRRSSK